MGEYISTSEATKKRGLIKRRTTTLCSEGRVPNAIYVGDRRLIPANKKRADARIKSGIYTDAKNSSYNLCLFDLDGTLTDPKIGITKSYQYALSTFDIHEELDNLIKFIGPPLRDVFRENYGFSNSDVERAVVKFREYFSETGLLENEVYPGIREVLKELKINGIVMAVATSKVTAYANRILKHFQLDDYFSFVSGDDMAGSLTKNGKRDIINIVLDGIDPERKMSAVMIGDRKHDIIGARENGIDSIGVTWGYGSNDELETAAATRIADTTDALYFLIT